MKSSKIYLLLWTLCLFGSWFLIPYSHYLGILPASTPIATLFFITTLQAIVLYGVVCWLSHKLVPKTDLEPFVKKNRIYTAVISGILVGLLIYILDTTLFQSSQLSEIHLPLWASVLASIYGGVNEEVLLRLFLFTLVYFLFRRSFNVATNNRLYFLWATNIIVALIFGLGHLPAAFKLTNPSSFEIFRILLLNGIPGLVFGWLYWTRGLWLAMTAHFVTDLMIHVLL